MTYKFHVIVEKGPLNPPYGRHVDAWVARLVMEYERATVTEAIALVPSRTDTAWFGRLDGYPRCYIRGRLKFSGADAGANFPSAVFYFGPNPERFREAFAPFGRVWLP